jgi:hypothetical protein
VSASQMSCFVPIPKSIELKIGQRWQFFDSRCQRIEATIWDISAPWPDGVRRVHLREDHAISWEATDVEMLTDPTWTLLSNPGGGR